MFLQRWAMQPIKDIFWVLQRNGQSETLQFFQNSLTAESTSFARSWINLISADVMYNPKSEKVGTVWKTQIKKESSDF